MLSRLFLPVVQTLRYRYPTSAMFEVNVNTKIRGFDEVWCREVEAILRKLNMEHGLQRRSISFSSTAQLELSTPNPGETAYRGYPLSNLFLYRKPTDGGLYTIPSSISSKIKSDQDTFDMPQHIKDRELEAIRHLTGHTEYRSFTEAVAVAFAFALAKGPNNGAIAVEHWAKEGSVLLASLYPPASRRDLYQVLGLLYQKEIAGPMLPPARQKCTTIVYKKDGCLDPESGFNIMSPLNLDVNQFLLANGDPLAVTMIHDYDQKALRASIEFSDASRELLEGQMKNLPPEEMSALQERWDRAYQRMLKLEKQFRKNIASSIKEQVEQGNPLMAQLDIPAEISIEKALRWYMSALCYSKGKFLTPQDTECSLNVNKHGDFILEWPQKSGATITKTFSKAEALAFLPHIMLPMFDLIAPDGQFSIGEGLPEPVEQVLVTSLITLLINKKDPHAGTLTFQAPDASEVSSLCEKAIEDSEHVQSKSQGISS